MATILGSCISVSAQKTSFEMAELMTRGINLGNTFDSELYEGAWAPVAKEIDFDGYKEAGFNTIRIPITWGATLSEQDSTPRVALEKPYKINEQFLNRVDEVVNWSLDRGFVTIINLHHEKWAKKAADFDDNKARLYAIWKHLSKHYKDYPETLLFEMLNEPHHEDENGDQDGLTVEQVHEVNTEVLAIIRKHNPTRVTIYGGPAWGGLNELQKMVTPDSTDNYLMGTYHSYSPWNYAGEGIGSWGTDEDKKAMAGEFEGLKEYSKKNNVPVFIGEFGAQHKCTYNTRMQHYAYYIENVQKHKVPATAWDDNGFLFKVYDRNTNVWDDAMDIITKYTPDSPNGLTLDIWDGNVVNIAWKNRAETIEKVIIERRVGRVGSFEPIATIDFNEALATTDESVALASILKHNKYTDNTPKIDQTTYYYRIVNKLTEGKELISYPQLIYIP